MTEVIFRYGADASVEVSGHSGYAERGRDIVCASVSSICNCMMAVFCVLEGQGRCHSLCARAEDGRFFLSFCGADGQASEVLASFELLLRNLEREFPQYLKVHP